MADIYETADDYTPEDLNLVRAGCLDVAVRFGDLLDEMIIVGGMVPSLLVDLPNEGSSSDGRGPLDQHIGTQDLDLGFAVALLDEERYREISKRLRQHNFRPDENEAGNLTSHRWRHTETKLTIDFLISPIDEDDAGGNIRNLESDFSAIVIPGLDLAFEDRKEVNLSGEMLNGSHATRDIPVCGPGAFVVLKALAWRMRGAQKDAYDLFYVVRNYHEGPADVADQLRPFLDLDRPEAEKAVNILVQDFDHPTKAGPAAVSEFVYGHANDEALRADVAAFIAEFLNRMNA